ncbi:MULTISPECIES: hypothetical protein [unclassified Streptomyces]|uniref:hypothetical protein n=1 Tax=unclassified Streptomyces TaxID=2593676 RepID=UPI002E77E71D|nr:MULTISPECIES: hypothetical protein [unclassified Streptomyces]MEE1761361.1 hypothetical protein [Streptomyces sp. SP18BB07]MEE1836058.1 hypothetical protein [Streptomyces sp. SP17KL33]
MALTEDHTAFSRIHPDGDVLVLVDADHTVRRAVAASPGVDWVAITRGGHGEVHVFDARTATEATCCKLAPTAPWRTRDAAPSGRRPRR